MLTPPPYVAAADRYATMPYVLKLAAKGWRAACQSCTSSVTRGRREMKLLAYLALRAPGEERRNN